MVLLVCFRMRSLGVGVRVRMWSEGCASGIGLWIILGYLSVSVVGLQYYAGTSSGSVRLGSTFVVLCRVPLYNKSLARARSPVLCSPNVGMC